MQVIQDQKPILWLIDENPYELRTHYKILSRMLPDLEVRAVEAYPDLVDYIPMLTEPRTACIITDERLKERGTANYLGIQLAEYLRGINKKIPIYILTNYADDRDEFQDGEWSIEDIIRKDALSNEDEQKILSSRIMRHINSYEDILSKREQRFQTLLMKSMQGRLDESDLQELEELRFQKVSPGLAKELAQIGQMEQLIKAHEGLMDQFKHFFDEGADNVI